MWKIMDQHFSVHEMSKVTSEYLNGNGTVTLDDPWDNLQEDHLHTWAEVVDRSEDTCASDSRTVQNTRTRIIATSYLRQVSHSLANNLGRRIVRDAAPAATPVMLVAV